MTETQREADYTWKLFFPWNVTQIAWQMVARSRHMITY